MTKSTKSRRKIENFFAGKVTKQLDQCLAGGVIYLSPRMMKSFPTAVHNPFTEKWKIVRQTEVPWHTKK